MKAGRMVRSPGREVARKVPRRLSRAGQCRSNYLGLFSVSLCRRYRLPFPVFKYRSPRSKLAGTGLTPLGVPFAQALTPIPKLGPSVFS